jgi:hypothetical protein
LASGKFCRAATDFKTESALNDINLVIVLALIQGEPRYLLGRGAGGAGGGGSGLEDAVYATGPRTLL